MRNQQTPTPAPTAREPEDTRFSISEEPGEVLRDAAPIVFQWERLASMNRRSPDFLPLFSILIGKTNLPLTAKLRGNDAGATLDSLIKVLREGKVPIEYERDARSIMRTLAYNSSQVPPRHLLLPGTLSEEGITITHGGSSELREVKLDDKTVAVKILRTGREDALKIFCKECVTWLSISNPHILLLIAANIDSRTGQYSMISEMMWNGNIKGYISSKPVDLNSRLSLLRDAAVGIHYLHERDIIHGDIKGHNILITNETPARACLADFGLTTLTPNPLGGPTTITAGGTLLYMAPELLHPVKFGRKDSRPTRPADMYAFGMVIYEVLTGLDPFDDKKEIGLSLIPLVINGTRPIRPRNAGEIGLEGGTWELVKACWKPKVKKRPTIEMALAHLSLISGSPMTSDLTSKLSQSGDPDSLKFNVSNLLRPLRSVLPTIHGLDLQAAPSAPSPDDIRPLPLPSPNTQINHSNTQMILSQWSHLRTLNPKSHDYIELLKRLVDVEANRRLALGLTGKDAGILIDAIDKGLRGGTLQPKVAHHSFSLLCKLAANTGQLPVSYSVNKDARFRVEEKIFACGSFADLRKGKLNKRTVAVKTIRVAQDTNITKIRKDFSQEAVLWMNTSHPNILELIGVNVEPQNRTFSLISEFMVNGNIMGYIRVNKANRIRLLEDVTKGLRYLHRCEIIHGDLKGYNILIKNGKTPQACISDFGFSTVAPTGSFAMPASVDEQKGTWSHMAPELLLPTKFGLQSGRPSKQGDVYAFGMAVYEVLTGRTPFEGEGRWMAEIVMRIADGKRPGKPKNAEDIGFGRGTWELVQRCWHENRGERPTVEEIRVHFQSVARTSTVVGPTVVECRVESQTTTFEPESFMGESTRLFVPSSQESLYMIRQDKFVASVQRG